jgi:hypothetical protein
MKNDAKAFPEVYETPSISVVETSPDLSFLQSNTEPIEGGDDPYIDW